MKRIFLLSILVAVAASCTKDPMGNSSVQSVTSSSAAQPTSSVSADIVYHYRGIKYPLTLQEHSTENFVKDAAYFDLKQATASSDLVTFHFADQPSHHIFLFDSEFEGYDYVEKEIDALLGRKFKIAHRIDELRDALIAQYGEPLDFSDAALEADALSGVQALYDELHINLPLPRALPEFIGVEGSRFSPSSGRNDPVLTVWADADYQGSTMDVEDAPNTVLWNYGDFNCFTMAANPDLTLEFQPNGNNWNDCISSQCLTYIQGADAMAVGYYKDADFGIYPCSRMISMYNMTTGLSTTPSCFNMNWYVWQGGAFCGHFEDQISSVRIKAVWEGCYTDNSVFSDMINE